MFIKVWKNLENIDPTQSLKAWIFAIARNTAIDLLRKRKSVVFSDFETEEGNVLESTMTDSEPLPDKLFETKESEKVLEDALKHVSLEYRTIIVLHDIEDMTFEEIAIIVKKPMNTVKSQYRRAIQTLREFLKNAPK